MTASTITLGHAHDSEWSKEQPSAHRGWLYAVAGVAVAAVGTIAVVSALQDDGATTSTGSAVVAEQATSSQALVQQSIDDALAAQRTAAATQPSSQALVQESIDDALAAQRTATATQPSSQALVQQSIDEALAAHRATPAPPVMTPFIGVR
ncbi:MAG: hypothetical protein AAFY28_07620 [Actinomycetota bacterium]